MILEVEVYRGHALLGGRHVDEQTEKRAAESVEEADLPSTDVETGERTCRSSHVRNS